MRRLNPNGLEAWAQVVAHGWEGLVAKDEASPYVPGARTRRWVKVMDGCPSPWARFGENHPPYRGHATLHRSLSRKEGRRSNRSPSAMKRRRCGHTLEPMKVTSSRARRLLVGLSAAAAGVLIVAGILMPFELRWDISRWKRDPENRWISFHLWSEPRHISDQEFDEGFTFVFQSSLGNSTPALRIEGDNLVVTATLQGHIRVSRILTLLRE